MELLEVKRRERLRREEAATRLRQLADSLARHNQLEFVEGSARFRVDVADEIEVEVDLEVEDGGVELEIAEMVTPTARGAAECAGRPACGGTYARLSPARYCTMRPASIPPDAVAAATVRRRGSARARSAARMKEVGSIARTAGKRHARPAQT